MIQLSRLRCRVAVAAGLAASLLGCGGSPQRAQKALAKMNVVWSVSEFVDRAAAGDTAVVALFLKGGMSPDAVSSETGTSALSAAVSSSRLETVRAILDAGHVSDSVLYDAALEASDGEIAKALVKAEASRIVEVIFRALGERDTGSRLELFLGAGAPVKGKDRHGRTLTPLAAAVSDGPGAVKLLIERGADANAQDEEGQTALMRAADRADSQLVELLLTHGADAALKDRSGRTAAEFVTHTGEPADALRERLRAAAKK